LQLSARLRRYFFSKAVDRRGRAAGLDRGQQAIRLPGNPVSANLLFENGYHFQGLRPEPDGCGGKDPFT
jgi:hypothetical protein